MHKRVPPNVAPTVIDLFLVRPVIMEYYVCGINMTFDTSMQHVIHVYSGATLITVFRNHEKISSMDNYDKINIVCLHVNPSPVNATM